MVQNADWNVYGSKITEFLQEKKLAFMMFLMECKDCTFAH